MDNPKLPLIEKAKKIINDSDLSTEDQKLVNERIPYAPTILLEMFIQSCSGDPFMLEVMVKSFKRKLMAGDNTEKLRAIMKEEREEIRKLIHATA